MECEYKATPLLATALSWCNMYSDGYDAAVLLGYDVAIAASLDMYVTHAGKRFGSVHMYACLI